VLKEDTRERVPLDWAMTTGNQDVTLNLFAERRGDAKMSKLAVQQIEAFTTSRDGGDADSAATRLSLMIDRSLVVPIAKN
jgi:hypothetical protein